MPRPCRHDKPDPACVVCFQYERDPALRALWDGVPPASVPLPVLPPDACRKLGAVTGRVLESAACRCKSCGRPELLPVHGCSVHGECTLTKAEGYDRGEAPNCCSLCDHADPLAVRIDLAGQACFNPALVEWAGTLLFPSGAAVAGAQTPAAPLDRAPLRPAAPPRRLRLEHPLCAAGREDPRLVVYDGAPHVFFHGVDGAGEKRNVHMMGA